MASIGAQDYPKAADESREDFYKRLRRIAAERVAKGDRAAMIICVCPDNGGGEPCLDDLVSDANPVEIGTGSGMDRGKPARPSDDQPTI